MTTLKNLRNELWTGAFSDANRAELQEVVDSFQSSKSPFSELVEKVAGFALEDIEEGQFKKASVELNVINELPATEEDCEAWDKEWFYKNELAVYFEKSKNVDRLETFIDLLAKAQESYKQKWSDT